MNANSLRSHRAASCALRASLAACMLVGCSAHTPPVATREPPAAPVAPAPAVAPLPPARGFADLQLRHVLRGARPASRQVASLKTVSATLPRGAKSDVREIYKRVAPATVIVRAPDGMGTGFLVSPDGFVVTNHHVVEGGAGTDLKVKVTVEIGRFNAAGLMERGAKSYDAFVHAWNPGVDLAVLKLVDPPANLPYLKIAAQDPAPGEAVTAIGHGKLGLLWAIKDGEIASIGKLSESLATLANYQCTSAAPEGSERCTAMTRYLDAERKALEQHVPALVIQTSCTLSRGDSGGPLVNRNAEVVGVNAFLRADEDDPITSNFHVHVSELRNLMRAVPAAPALLAPDPWVDGGPHAELVDKDLDGRMDSLLLSGEDSTTVLVDLDEDSFGTGQVPPVEKIVEARSFRADFALLAKPDALYAWYDTDGDGTFDRLLVAPADEHDKPSAAFAIGADGLQQQPVPARTLMIDPAMVPGDEKARRFRRLLHELMTEEVRLAGAAPLIPDPVLAAGTSGALRDVDGDGVRETLVLSNGTVSIGMLDGADQPFEGATPATLAALVGERRVKPWFSVVRRGDEMWTFNDPDADGRMDLVLYASDADRRVAQAAWKLDAQGAPTPEPSHVGRLLVRPELATASRAARVRSWGQTAFRSLTASDDGLGSLPDPFTASGGDAEMVRMKGSPTVLARVEGLLSEVVLFDLTGATVKQKGFNEDKLGELIEEGRFRTDLALLDLVGMQWAFYDTDGDKKFDLVLFSPDGDAAVADRGFRIDKANKLVLDPELEGTPLVSPQLFAKRATAARLLEMMERVQAGE